MTVQSPVRRSGEHGEDSHGTGEHHGSHSIGSSSRSSSVDNRSFTSHYSSMGRAQGAGADLESMGQATLSEHESVAESLNEEDVKLWSMTKRFVKLGYPLSISALAQFSLNAVIISVIGRFLGVEPMGGASLAIGLVNATGFAFGAGLCGALETVLSHTYGRFKQEERRGETNATTTIYMYGIYAQRMAIILFITAIPLGVVLCFADSILTAAGESIDVTYYTGVWCRVAMFGVPLAMMFQLVQRYYSCQHVTKPLSVTMVCAAVVNPFLQMFFVYLFGFVGSALAWLVLMFGINGGLVSYLRFTGLYKLTWGGWCKKGRKNLYPLVKIAIPSMGVMLSEWVALEINFLAAGFATPNELAAYAITFQVFGIIWGFASGVIILTCVFVGNAVGEGKPLLARKIGFMAMGIVLAISIADAVILLLLNPYFPYLFTTDPQVAEIYQRLMYIVLPYHLFDTFQSVVMGILRGCGLQKIGAIIITTAFCGVGVPLSFLLFFYFDVDVKALWIGPFTGAVVVGLPSYLYLLFRYIDWENIKPHTDGDGGHASKGPENPGEIEVSIVPGEVPEEERTQQIQDYLEHSFSFSLVFIQGGTTSSDADAYQVISVAAFDNLDFFCTVPPSMSSEIASSTSAADKMGSPGVLETPNSPSSTLDTASMALPAECFLLSRQNPGFQIPYFLSSEEEVRKIRPPAVVKTWEQRYAELSDAQKGKFDAFNKMVQEKEWYDPERYDEWCLIRYLTARNFDPSKALQQLEKTVEWLKDPLNSSTACEICQTHPEQHCGQFCGWDLQHRPVMFMSMQWGPERKHPLKHMIAAFNHLVRMMPVGVEKWVCITDFETYSHLKDSNPSMGMSVIQTIQTHFPERLGKMICINPPTMFWMLWKLFSPVIDPPTKEKVEFLYTEDTPSVYERFPKLFPEYLRNYLYDSYDRSKYSILADPLIWYPSSEPYPENFAERQAQLKNIKKRLEQGKKEAKEYQKQQKKLEKDAKKTKKLHPALLLYAEPVPAGCRWNIYIILAEYSPLLQHLFLNGIVSFFSHLKHNCGLLGSLRSYHSRVFNSAYPSSNCSIVFISFPYGFGKPAASFEVLLSRTSEGVEHLLFSITGALHLYYFLFLFFLFARLVYFCQSPLVEGEAYFCLFTTLSVKLDFPCDFFDVRLKEINSEMQGILDRTKQRRSELYAMPPAEAALPAIAPAAAPSPQCAAPLDSVPSDYLEKTISRVCQVEVAKWMEANLHTFLEPVIQSHAGKQVDTIQRGLQDLRFSHREVLSVVQEVKSEIDEQRNRLQSAVSRIERQALAVQQQLHEDVEGKTKKLQEVLGGVEESVIELQKAMKEEQRRSERRLEDAVKRQQESVHAMLVRLEDQVFHWRDELSARVRQHIDQMRGNQSSLETHVVRLQGMLDSTVEAVNRQALDVRGLMEEGVERRSELRTCRRDVNRLDMLVQCLAGGYGTGAQQPGASGASTGRTSSPGVDTRSSMLLMQELLGVKEKLESLNGRIGVVEGAQDHLDRAIDERLTWAASVAGQPLPVISSMVEGLHRRVGQLQKSLDGANTSATTTAPVDPSVTAPDMSGSRAANTSVHDSCLRGGLMGRRAASEGTGLHATIATPIAATRLPQDTSLNNGPEARPLRSHGSFADIKESVDRFGNSVRGSPPPTQPQNTSHSALPSTVAAPSVPGGTLFLSGNSLRQKLSEAATRQSSDEERKDEPEDSYVSMNPPATKSRPHRSADPTSSGKTSSSGKAETYAPPPTSDSESDRDNHALLPLQSRSVFLDLFVQLWASASPYENFWACTPPLVAENAPLLFSPSFFSLNGLLFCSSRIRMSTAAAATSQPSGKTPFVRETRSVKIPHHRFPPLKKVWMEVYTPIVEQCKLEIRMNLKTRSVDLRTSPLTATGEAGAQSAKVILQKAEDFIKAVIAGFDVRDAVALLRLDDVYIEGFEIKDVRANLDGDNLSRCIGRISGSHGKTKYTIENVTRTRIVLADTKIWIMGTTQNTQVARNAICDLIRGSPAAKVYTRIRAVMNRVNDSF
eukprot:gene5370-3865_t